MGLPLGSGSRTISQMEVKCFSSLSSFVNMSDMFNFPGTCRIFTNFFWTSSGTAFSHICMCRSPFVVRINAHWTHAALSLYILVGAFMNFFCSLRSVNNWRR